MQIDYFPHNVIENILNFIPDEDLPNIRLVTKKFNHIICTSRNLKVHNFFKNFIFKVLNTDEINIEKIINDLDQRSEKEAFILRNTLESYLNLTNFITNKKLKKLVISSVGNNNFFQHTYEDLELIESSIHDACIEGNEKLLRLLLIIYPYKISIIPFADALNFGYPRIAKLLLEEKRIIVTEESQLAIRTAAKYGDLEIVKLLLHDKDIEPSAQANQAVLKAAKYGHIEIVNALLQHHKFNYEENLDHVLESAVINSHEEIVKILIENPKCKFSYGNNNNALSYAAYCGNQKILEILFEVKRFQFYYIAYFEAIKYGHLDIVKSLIFSKKIDSTCNKDLDLATQHGQSEIVKFLIKNLKVKPSALTKALNIAIEYRYPEIVNIILSDHRIQPYDHYHFNLHFAVRHWRDIEIVEILLKNKWLDAKNFEDERYKLLDAAMKGSLDVIKEIKLDFWDNDYYYSAISLAIKNGHIKIAKKILKKFRNKRIYSSYMIFKNAEKKGCLKEIKSIFKRFQIQ